MSSEKNTQLGWSCDITRVLIHSVWETKLLKRKSRCIQNSSSSRDAYQCYRCVGSSVFYLGLSLLYIPSKHSIIFMTVIMNKNDCFLYHERKVCLGVLSTALDVTSLGADIWDQLNPFHSDVFPLMHIDAISMELSILYSVGSQIAIFKL